MKVIVNRVSRNKQPPNWDGPVEQLPSKYFKKEWIVEISSLEELVRFGQKNGELVFRSYEDGVFDLEIYDDWRE